MADEKEVKVTGPTKEQIEPLFKDLGKRMTKYGVVVQGITWIEDEGIERLNFPVVCQGCGSTDKLSIVLHPGGSEGWTTLDKLAPAIEQDVLVWYIRAHHVVQAAAQALGGQAARR